MISMRACWIKKGEKRKFNNKLITDQGNKLHLTDTKEEKLDNIVNKSTITFYTVKSLNIVVQKFLESSRCFQI